MTEKSGVLLIKEDISMYYFKDNGTVDLYADGSPVITGLTPWMNPTLGGRVYLKAVSVSETAACFSDEENISSLILSIKEQNGCFAVCANGSYNPYGTHGHGTHLDDLCGIGIDLDIPHDGRYLDNFMNCLFWQRPFTGSGLKNIKERTQSLLLKQHNKKLYLMTVCGKDYKSELFPNDSAASLTAHSNTVCDRIDDVVLVGGVGDNEYRLTEQVAGYGLKVMNKPGRLRKYKKYPDPLEYLGWCSWDAFHMDVTDADLFKKAEEYKSKGIPVRWMIIDDMWGDVSCIDLGTMHYRELNSFEADPVRFPRGLKKTVSEIKSKYGLMVGLWHPTTGYWRGINPNGIIAEKYGRLLEYTIPGFSNRASRYMHSFDRRKMSEYYDIQHKFYEDCGIDFVKIDNQGYSEALCFRKGSVGECLKNMHGAIERSVKKHFGGEIINCMGMPVENFWNRTYSNVCRFSGDFLPEDRKWFVEHLLQCSYNSLTQGAVFTGDWDMWWSDDAQAKKNAVLRSMSGGPIYMSDKLGRSIKEVIMPTVFSDGRIIRLKNPAMPAKDCIFDDCRNSGKIFKIFNRYKNTGIVAAFNTDSEEQAVKGTVSATDIDGLKDGKYCVYDWFGRSVTVLEKGEAMEVELENYDDFRLFIFVPIVKGRADIGLTDKYITTATFEKSKETITVLDSGEFAVYSENELKGFDTLASNLYVKPVKKGETL